MKSLKLNFFHIKYIFPLWVIISILLKGFNLNAQNIYYISSSAGNDNNSGSSENEPLKTIVKLNSITFQPGDRILFKCSDKWEEGIGLKINNSGTKDKRIRISSYGTGEKPVISLFSEIKEWKNESNWSKVKGDTIWKISFPDFPITSISIRINRLWLNGIEFPRAKDLSSSNLDELTSGQLSTYGVNGKHRFYHDCTDENNPTLYLWTEGTNPAVYYSRVEYCGNYMDTPLLHPLELIDADFITIENLEFKGGIYSSIGLSGSDYIIVNNCNLGFSQHTGIIGDRQSGLDKTSENLELSNCKIDNERTVKINFYDGMPEYGICAASGSSNWLIHHNFIKNWRFGFLTVSNFNTSTYHQFFNNEVTSPDIEYSKPVQIGGTENPFSNKGHKIFNNYFHHVTVGLQVSGTPENVDSNEFYFNILAYFTASENEHATQGNSGFGFNLHDSKNNLIFNNTFYDMNNSGIVDWTTAYLQSFNNLFINTAKVVSYWHSQVRMYSTTGKSYENNLFFYLSGNPTIWIEPSSYYVDQFNALGFADNNLKYTGELNNLINLNDFSLPDYSPAIGSGKNIEAFIPEGFKDLKGNIVNRINPPIGAIESALYDLNIKVFLESAYSTEKMKSGLSGYLPLTQPYFSSPWNYKGTELVANIPADVVDWILVELRRDTSASSAAARRAAFLKSDGSIVDLDGISPLHFNSLDKDNYYVAVKHRNHLGVLSSNKISLGGTFLYDFTISPSEIYGGDLAELGDGKYGMYAGDADGNGVINVLDFEIVGNNLYRDGYLMGDVDMNGAINVLDYGKTNHNLLKSSKTD